MKLCSGDVGFSAKKTFDLEVWLPGQNSGKVCIEKFHLALIVEIFKQGE